MILLLIILSIACIWFATKPARVIIISEQNYWDGPIPTSKERKENLQRIFSVIEQFPEGQLAKNNPECVDEYLKRIDIDLPKGIEKSKE